MNKTLLLAGVAVSLFAANANAADLQQYVSAKLTYSDASHDVKWTDTYTNEKDETVNESGKQKFSDNVWGGSLAYGVKSGAVRTELELNIKQDAEKKISGSWSEGEGDDAVSGVETTKLSVENNSVMINAYYDINTGTKLTPYVGAGIGMAHLKATAKYDDGKDSKSKNNFAWQVGAGVAYALTDNVVLDAGYRYTDAGDVKISDGESTNKYEAQSHEFLLGARYSF